MTKADTRTTITISEDLLFAVKKKALYEKKTIKEIIEESLLYYLQFTMANKPTLKIGSLFGVWGKGASGETYVKKIRSSSKEKEREKYLAKLWKKS